MTTVVLLIRHAAHDRLGRQLCGRMPGVTLGAAGRSQAQALAAALRPENLKAVLASPLERCVETAQPIAAARGLSAEIDADLNEIDLGAWSGQGFEALAGDPAWMAWNARRDLTRPPGGETMIEAQVRVVRCIERLSLSFPGSSVAVVSHADIIKVALAWGLGLPLAQVGRFEISPASISRLVVGPWGSKVWTLNQELAPEQLRGAAL